MLETAVRADALRSTDSGFEFRIGLPWIRSMPLSGVTDLSMTLDGDPFPVRSTRVVLGHRRVEPAALADVAIWWFLQDRLVLAGDRRLLPGAHTVAVDFRLLVPYLKAGPGVPLVLPFHLEAELVLDHPTVPSVSRDVG